VTEVGEATIEGSIDTSGLSGLAARLRSGDVSENPATRERVIALEAPAENPERRLTSELHLVPGAAVMLEHMHPRIEETFEVIEGRLGWKLDGKTGEAGPGETLEIPAGSWHDWWHVGEEPTICRVTVTPGDRFTEMVSTLWGVGIDGIGDAKGAPKPLQLVALSREFGDVFVPRKPPAFVQKALFGLLGPIAHRRGYRATYPRYDELRFEGTPEDVREGRPITPIWGDGAGPPELRR
jgi:mannose-6-phosphate isomerase-like protein (cupin superfamily)